MITRPEVLAPAGDMECLNSALSFGADAVFLAGKMFGMRSASKNFDNTQLKQACERPSTGGFERMPTPIGHIFQMPCRCSRSQFQSQSRLPPIL